MRGFAAHPSEPTGRAPAMAIDAHSRGFSIGHLR
jgi:hypothetical protein